MAGVGQFTVVSITASTPMQVAFENLATCVILPTFHFLLLIVVACDRHPWPRVAAGSLAVSST